MYSVADFYETKGDYETAAEPVKVEEDRILLAARVNNFAQYNAAPQILDLENHPKQYQQVKRVRFIQLFRGSNKFILWLIKTTVHFYFYNIL